MVRKKRSTILNVAVTQMPDDNVCLTWLKKRLLCVQAAEKEVTWASTQKSYNKTCVTSKDSDKPVHPPSLAKVLVYLFLDSLKAVEGTRYQRRLWSNCANVQADLSLRWSHKSYCRFYRVLGHFLDTRNLIWVVTVCFKTIVRGSFNI